MKIKAKQTIETEIEVQVPCFFKHSILPRYYAIYSEDKEDPYAGAIVSEKGIEGVYAETVASASELTIITEEEFNLVVEPIFRKIKSLCGRGWLYEKDVKCDNPIYQITPQTTKP